MIELEFLHGDAIADAIAKAVETAAETDDTVAFGFNSLRFVVAADSDESLLYRDYWRGMEGCLGESPTIGPYPAPLTELDKARDRWHVAKRRLKSCRGAVKRAIEEYDLAAKALMQLDTETVK